MSSEPKRNFSQPNLTVNSYVFNQGKHRPSGLFEDIIQGNYKSQNDVSLSANDDIRVDDDGLQIQSNEDNSSKIPLIPAGRSLSRSVKPPAIIITPPRRGSKDSSSPKLDRVRNGSRNFIFDFFANASCARKRGDANGDPYVQIGKNSKEQKTKGSSYTIASNQTERSEANDIFICHLCHNPFSDPRILDCLHTFCSDCLLELDFTRNKRNRNQSFHGSRATLLIKDDESQIQSSPSVQSNLVSEFCKPESSSSESGNLNLKEVKRSPLKIDRMKILHERTSSSGSIIPLSLPKVFICPVCGYQSELPTGGVARIPKNYVVARKSRHDKETCSDEVIEDTICSLCCIEVTAIAHCSNCDINLCNFCKEAHQRQRYTSSHDVNHLTDLKKSRELTTPNGNTTERQSEMCTIHPNSDLKLYCTPCKQVICRECTIVLHQGHKCETIYRASKIYTKLMKDSMERTQPLHDYANCTISKLTVRSKKVIQRADFVQNEIEVFIDEYFKALEVHKRTLLNQVMKWTESKIQLIADQQSDLERRSKEARNAIQFAADVFAVCNDVEILSLTGIILRRLEFCQKSKSLMDGKSADSLQFLSDLKAPGTKEQNNIPLYGIITTQTPAPKLCVLESEGLMFLRVHRKTNLIVKTNDEDNRPLCHGGLIMKVELRYSETGMRLIPTEVSDKRNGSYVISFVPDLAGVMLLSIKINEEGIKGSPFTMCAKTLRPHSGLYHCCAFCSSKGSRTATCACECIMPGGYKGCGHGHAGHPGRRHWSCCANTLEHSECSATNFFRDQFVKER